MLLQVSQRYWFGIDRVTIMHANHLQPIDFHFFIVQDLNACPQQRRQILGIAVELFMIARDVIDTQRRRLRGRDKVMPGPGKYFKVAATPS